MINYNDKSIRFCRCGCGESLEGMHKNARYKNPQHKGRYHNKMRRIKKRERMERRFKEYHLAYPYKWVMIRDQILRSLLNGKKNISVKRTVEVLREYRNLTIDNTYTALYGRMFIEKYPQYKDQIKIREK